MELSVRRQFSSEPSAPVAPAVILEDPRIRWRNIVIVAAAFVAFFLKLAIAYNTFGTNDVVTFYMFARSLADHGLEWTYQNGFVWFSNFPVFNHPPLTAYYLQFIGYISHQEFFRSCGLTFPFLLRLPGIIADLVVVIILMRLQQVDDRLRIPSWALALFAISPVSVMISGFHGNTDPIVVMFLVLAAYACLLTRPVLCGISFALSCQVKVIPLLFLPIIFFYWLERDAAKRFATPFVLLSLTMCAEPLIRCPTLLLKNVLGYGGFWGGWGISYCLSLTDWPQFSGTGFFKLPPAAVAVSFLLKLTIVAAVFLLAWRRRQLPGRAVIDSIAYAWIVFFVFAPGVCPQYMVWLAPFVLLLSPKLYAWLTAASSIALFFLYNALSGGLPWYIGIARNSAHGESHLLPWELLPWITLIVGMTAFWSNAFVTRSSVREQLP